LLVNLLTVLHASAPPWLFHNHRGPKQSRKTSETFYFQDNSGFNNTLSMVRYARKSELTQRR
jgi:hypothetical protein